MTSNQKNYADSAFKNCLSSLTIDSTTFPVDESVGAHSTGKYKPTQIAFDWLAKLGNTSSENNPNSFKNLVVDDVTTNAYLSLDRNKIMSGFGKFLINHEFSSLLFHAYCYINSAS